MESTKNLSNKEIATEIRTWAKVNCPDWKLSVTSDLYAVRVAVISTTIDILERDTIREEAAKEAKIYADDAWGRSLYRSLLQSIESDTVDYNIRHLSGSSKQLYSKILTESALETLTGIEDLADSYNYDNSDPYRDYFDCGFYFSLTIGNYKNGYSVC